jgi:hypothetical protein
LPPCVLRDRTMRPAVARDALLAPHGGLSLAWGAVIGHLSPLALARVICAFGHHSVGTVLPRCGWSWPTESLAEEQHRRGLPERLSCPTIGRGRGLWHVGESASKSAAAFTAS